MNRYVDVLLLWCFITMIALPVLTDVRTYGTGVPDGRTWTGTNTLHQGVTKICTVYTIMQHEVSAVHMYKG